MKNLSSKEQLDFKTLGTIKSSGESIYWRETKIDKADHKNRLIYQMRFQSLIIKQGQNKKNKNKKDNILNSVANLFEGRELVLNAFKGRSLPFKSTERKGLKILTPKQLLQRLPIALAKVKASNNSGSLLTEIKQNVYSLHQSKGITKKEYNNRIKSIQT